MRPLDIATIEPFVREALPLATDAEIAAILVRLGGRIVRPEEQARVQPGQGLGARTNAALLRGFLLGERRFLARPHPRRRPPRSMPATSPGAASSTRPR